MAEARKRPSKRRNARQSDRTSGSATAERFGGLVARDPVTRKLFEVCRRLAESEVPIIIEGETGVGKGVLAHAIHSTGPRSSRPFVAIDGGTVSRSDANGLATADGFVEALSDALARAKGGTMLIDEVADLSLESQGDLLRTVERAASAASSDGDTGVRIIATSRRPLDESMAAGLFRDDLFFRLAVGHVTVPPLRDRREDVPALAVHFWRKTSGKRGGPPRDVLLGFDEHPWPGNVRELENLIARRFALGDLAYGVDAPGWSAASETRRRRTIPEATASESADAQQALEAGQPLARARQEAIAGFERRYLREALSRHGGDVEAAARASGIAARYFAQLCKDLQG